MAEIDAMLARLAEAAIASANTEEQINAHIEHLRDLISQLRKKPKKLDLAEAILSVTACIAKHETGAPYKWDLNCSYCGGSTKDLSPKE